ncbi:MAG TPA: hypothetical protein VF596_07085 [Pyrinomonadaceae bacterium]|jgi:hypothetical protein
MGWQYWDGEKPFVRSREEIENQRDLKVINTLYVIDWLQSATGKEAWEDLEQQNSLFQKHRLLLLNSTLLRHRDKIPSDIAHNIDFEKVIKTIWGSDAKY